MKLIYVTGGARSGKSAFAEKYLSEQGKTVLYIATAIAFDREMQERIACHRRARPSTWRTVETNKDLAGVLAQAAEPLALLDCLTVWFNNLLLDKWRDDLTLAERRQLEKELQQELDKLLSADYAGQLVVVSNELGMGLVPENALGRFFRDLAGRANQRVAEAADEAYLLVSGLPIRLK